MERGFMGTPEWTHRLLVLIGSMLLIISGCGTPSNTDSSPIDMDAVNASDDTPTNLPDETPHNETVFTHKMMKSTDDNRFSALGYECSTCTFEQWLAIVPPEGWSKGPAQVLITDSGELRSVPSFEGVPAAVDFIDEIPGNEFELIVKVVDGELLAVTETAMITRSVVLRDTLLRFNPGRRIHELKSPEGDIYVLFAHGVDPTNPVLPDFDDPNVLGDVSCPEGWTYTSRIAEAGLDLDTSDTASIVAIQGETLMLWEKL